MTRVKELPFSGKPIEESTPLQMWQDYANDTTLAWRTHTLDELLEKIGAEKYPEDIKKKLRETAMLALALEEEEGENL